MLNIVDKSTRYDAVWRRAEPYMRARKNDVHVPLSFAWAQRLLDAHPEANRDIVSLAILLHDIGWYSIDMHDIIEKGFGPNMMKSDVRFLHEAEGVRLSRPVLEETGWPEEIIQAVAEIIDGHDTRADARHLNDRLVRDADKLWRFGVTGVSVACDWFKMNPHQYADKLQKQLNQLETETGRRWAAEELQMTRATLMLHVI